MYHYCLVCVRFCYHSLDYNCIATPTLSSLASSYRLRLHRNHSPTSRIVLSHSSCPRSSRSLHHTLRHNATRHISVHFIRPHFRIEATSSKAHIVEPLSRPNEKQLYKPMFPIHIRTQIVSGPQRASAPRTLLYANSDTDTAAQRHTDRRRHRRRRLDDGTMPT